MFYILMHKCIHKPIYTTQAPKIPTYKTHANLPCIISQLYFVFPRVTSVYRCLLDVTNYKYVAFQWSTYLYFCASFLPSLLPKALSVVFISGTVFRL